jgi:predicted kinase
MGSALSVAECTEEVRGQSVLGRAKPLVQLGAQLGFDMSAEPRWSRAAAASIGRAMLGRALGIAVRPRQLALMCGPAFSGKTTLAQALSTRGFVRLSPDDILRSRGLEPGDGLPDECWGQALADVCTRIGQLARTGASGVVDDTACYRWLRDRYRRVAAGCGLRPVLIVLRIDPSEVLRRVAANARNALREGIRDTVLRDHLDRFEWPGPDEDALEIDALWSLEQQVEATMRQLSLGPDVDGQR